MMRALKLLLVAGLLAALTVPAFAFSWGGYGPGPVKMKFTNYDIGTVYDTGGNGIWDVDNGDDFSALNPTYPTGAAAGEDSWGIFRLDVITSADGSVEIYNRFTADTEITGIFWGATDSYLEMTDYGLTTQTQETHSRGMNVAFFEDASMNFDYSPGASTGPNARVDVGDKPTFDTVTDGTLLWTMVSTPGWDANFLDDEFFGKFLPSAELGTTSASGGFYAELDAVAGWGTGPGNGSQIIDRDGYDVEFNFTGEFGPEDWQIISDDPIRCDSTPELSSATLGLMGLLPMGLVWWRRRRD